MLCCLALAAAVAAIQDDKPAQTPPMRWTGVLDEAEFQKLHELTREQAPPARGTMVEIGAQRAYLSLPEDATPPLPGVVVIHEWYGLNEHIKHWADRLAADGYAALAIDLYGGRVATDSAQAQALMNAVDEEQALAHLLAAHAFLADDPRIRACRRGVLGWCFGGGWSLRLAMAAPDLDAAVVYYGRLVDDPERLRAIRAPVLGIFGDRDRGIPPAAVDAFERAMREAGCELTVRRYDAEHAFANPSGARYDHAAAADAWKEVRAFLARHVKASAMPDLSAMRTYVFAMLKAGDKRGERIDAETTARLQEQHLAHIAAMARRGEIAFAGPMTERPGEDPVIGILLFTVSKAEAEKLVAEDPLVRAGRLRAELVEWFGPKWLAEKAPR